jgi:hypothetical protein
MMRQRSRSAFTVAEVLVFMVIGLTMLMMMIHLMSGENRLDRWAEARLDALARVSAALENMRRDAATAASAMPASDGARWTLQQDDGTVDYRWSGPNQDLTRAGARSQNLGQLATFGVSEGSSLVSVHLSAGAPASGATTATACLYVREPALKQGYAEWVPDASENPR